MKKIIVLLVVGTFIFGGCTSVKVQRGGQLSSSDRIKMIDSEIARLEKKTTRDENEKKETKESLQKLENAKVDILAKNPGIESYEAHGRTSFPHATTGIAQVTSANGTREVAGGQAELLNSQGAINRAYATEPAKFAGTQAPGGPLTGNGKTYCGIFVNNAPHAVKFNAPGQIKMPVVKSDGYYLVENVKSIPTTIVVYHAGTGEKIRESKWHTNDGEFEGKSYQFSFRLLKD